MSGLLLPSDHDRIADRVRDGDPVVGWRGDPTMDTYLIDATGEVQVFAFDRSGERYCAASVSAHSPGWKHELLSKLRDGDWQSGAAERWVNERNAEQDALEREHAGQLEERTDRLAWAVRRDVGTHVDGLSKEFY